MINWKLFQVFDDIISEKLDENVKRRAKQRIRIQDIYNIPEEDFQDTILDLLDRKLNFH